MKVIVWTGPREMHVREAPRPEPAAQEVVVKVDAAGICGSDMSGYLGHNSLRVPPLVMGHELAGRVTAVGEGVTAPRVGDLVAVNPLIACGECALCRRGLENLCPRREIVGIHRPGAFAEWVAVPAANCVTLPRGVDAVTGSLAEPLACGVRAVRIGGVVQGSRVLVVGAGTIGLMAIAAVRSAGGAVVLASDVHPGRLATAAAWGAARTCDARSTDSAALARQLTGDLGVDVAIDAVGSGVTRRAAIRAARPGGTVVFVGLHEAESPVEANHIVRSEIHISGSFAYTSVDFARALDMLIAGEVYPSPAWLEERALEACGASFAELIDTPPAVAKIVLRP